MLRKPGMPFTFLANVRLLEVCQCLHSLQWAATRGFVPMTSRRPGGTVPHQQGRCTCTTSMQSLGQHPPPTRAAQRNSPPPSCACLPIGPSTVSVSCLTASGPLPLRPRLATQSAPGHNSIQVQHQLSGALQPSRAAQASRMVRLMWQSFHLGWLPRRCQACSTPLAGATLHPPHPLERLRHRPDPS